MEASITNRFSVHPSGQIAVIEKGGCPWKDHLFSLEEERQIKGQILYLLYEDTSGQWRVQCVPEVSTIWCLRALSRLPLGMKRGLLKNVVALKISALLKTDTLFHVSARVRL